MYQLHAEAKTLFISVDGSKTTTLTIKNQNRSRVRVLDFREFYIALNTSYLVRLHLDTVSIVKADVIQADTIILSFSELETECKVFAPSCAKIDFTNVQRLGTGCFVWIGYKKANI